jgi:3-oxoacyl-[acyl-carrier protein] reductase
MTTQRAKVAIVTGAGRGIGRAIALELAAQGFTVVVNYSATGTGAAEVVAKIAARGGEALAVQADVRHGADLDRLFATTLEKFGHLDVLVNNAGVSGAAPLEMVSAEMVAGTFDVNFQGMLFASQRAARHFGPDGGAIVNLSSALVQQPIGMQAVYAASKAAVDATTRILAQELGPRKIRVNAVAPGPTETDLLQVPEEIRGYIVSRTILGRVGWPTDIAKVVAFLASDAAGWVTGQVIGADGGLRL